MATDTTQNKTGAGTLTAILTALQQGVQALNTVTQTMKSIFPSSS